MFTGWHVGVSTTGAEARLFGRRPAAPAPDLWHEAGECADVCARLWDSWEDDAEIRSTAAPRPTAGPRRAAGARRAHRRPRRRRDGARARAGERAAAGRGTYYRGDPVDLADLITQWHRAGAVDGFHLTPITPPATSNGSSTARWPCSSTAACSGPSTRAAPCASTWAWPAPPTGTHARGNGYDGRRLAADPETDAPRRALSRREQHHRLVRPALPQPDRVLLVRTPRAHGRAGAVRLLLPRRGAAAARAQGAHPRPGRGRQARVADRALRARGRHRPARSHRHRQHHLQRALRTGPPARHPRPPQRRPGRLERRHLFRRLHRRELPARRLPGPGREVHPRHRVRRHRPRAVGLLDPRRNPAPRRPPRPALHRRGRVHRPALPAGPPGRHPGRRLLRGPGVRRVRSRHRLHPARHPPRGPGLLRGREGAARGPRAGARRAEGHARRHLRTRRHRPRCAGARGRHPPPAGIAAERDRRPGAGLGPRPVLVRPGRAAARERPGPRRRAGPGAGPAGRPARGGGPLARAVRREGALHPADGHRGDRPAVVIGSPATAAALLAEYVAAGAADGFILAPHLTPGGLDDFVDRVVPLLQERGSSAGRTPVPRCGRTSVSPNRYGRVDP